MITPLGVLIPLLLLGWPLLAAAEPVYLQCTLVSGNTPHRLDVTIDATTRMVTQVAASGQTFTTQGGFTAETITYHHVVLPEGRRPTRRVTTFYRIDRRTLAFSATETMGQTDSPPAPQPTKPSDTGICMMVQRP